MRLIPILLLFFVNNLYSQIIGGAGVCHVNGNPNAITKLEDLSNSDCKISYDISSNDIYIYDVSLPVGSRWKLLNSVNDFYFSNDTIYLVTPDTTYSVYIASSLQGEVNGSLNNTTVDTVRRIWFDRNYTAPDSIGKLQWNSEYGTLDLGMGYDGVVQQIGQELYYVPVINKTASTIPNGTLVMIDTTQVVQGDRLRVMPAINNGILPSDYIVGVATMEILPNQLGLITFFGEVSELVESDIAQTGVTLNVGDLLYPSNTQPGKFTNVKPSAPYWNIPLAVVKRKPSVNNITILTRWQKSVPVNQLQDVNLDSLVNGSVLKYDNGIWKATSSEGITVADSNLYVTLNYLNSQGYLTTEVDGSITNEGILSTTTINTNWGNINTNTSGGNPIVVTVEPNTGQKVTFSTSTNGGGIVLGNDTTVVATRNYVNTSVDSTRLNQDSILIYYKGGVIVRQDTINIPPAGVTSITAGYGLTGGTITSTGTIAADTATVLVSKSFLTNQGYGTGTVTGSGTTGEFSYFSGSTALTSSPRVKFETDGGLVLKNTTEPVSTSFLASQTFTDTTGWTTGAGWAIGSGVATATAATSDLTYTGATLTITSGRAYAITISQTAYTSGTATLRLGNVNVVLPAATFTAQVFVLRPTVSTGGLRISGSALSASFDNIAIAEVTPGTVLQAHETSVLTNNFAPLVFPNSTSLIQGGGLYATNTSNTGYGVNALEDLTNGQQNTGFGQAALQRVTSGSRNTSIGYQSLQNLRSGTDNDAIGSRTLNALVSGVSNSGMGYETMRSLINGNFNTAIGRQALGSIVSSSGNTGIGYIAGFYSGTNFGVNTPFASSTNGTYIGTESRGSADGVTNESAFGYRAVGNGSNTMTFGNTSIVGYFLNGTGHLRLPSGTTAQRPGTPLVGMMRNNIDNNNLDFYTGTAWENYLKSATATGLGTAGRLFYADANGRATGSSNFTVNETDSQLFLTDGNTVNVNFYTNTTQLIEARNGNAQFRMISAGNGSGANDYSSITLSKARGTITSPTAPLLDNFIGGIISNAYNGTAGGGGTAGMFFIADADITSVAAPQRITFQTSELLNLNRVERMVIKPNGRIGVGTSTPARLFDVNGEVRISDLTTDTPTRIVGADADGDLGAITVGSGLTLSGGTLTASGAGTTNLTFSGASSPVTLNSDTGTDVTFTAGTNVTLSQSANNLTINASEDITNEGILGVNSVATNWVTLTSNTSTANVVNFLTNGGTGLLVQSINGTNGGTISFLNDTTSTLVTKTFLSTRGYVTGGISGLTKVGNDLRLGGDLTQSALIGITGAHTFGVSRVSSGSAFSVTASTGATSGITTTMLSAGPAYYALASANNAVGISIAASVLGARVAEYSAIVDTISVKDMSLNSIAPPTSQVPGVGFGARHRTQFSTGVSNYDATYITSKLIDVATKKTSLEFSTRENDAIVTPVKIEGSDMVLSNYGVGNKQDVQAYTLGVTSTGKVVEDKVSYGEVYINIPPTVSLTGVFDTLPSVVLADTANFVLEGSALKYIGTTTKRFLVNLSASMDYSQNANVFIRVRKNTTGVIKTRNYAAFSTGVVQNLSTNGIVELAPNDKIQAEFAASVNGVTVVSNLNLSITQL